MFDCKHIIYTYEVISKYIFKYHLDLQISPGVLFQGALSEAEDAEAEDAVMPLERMWIMRWPYTLRK